MVKQRVTIIDYGSGNLRSAARAFEHMARERELDIDVAISSDPSDILNTDKIVLPGQGAFGDCMNGLSGIKGMIEALDTAVIKQGKPFFGICVGMQLLADKGFENGEHKGLGWIGGEVVPLSPDNPNLKIPHMGWNVMRPSGHQKNDPHFVLRSIDSSSESPSHYYFVHSFQFKVKDDTHALALCDYGGDFVAVTGRDNIIGMQFHPEKSHKDGLTLIGDFLKWRP